MSTKQIVIASNNRQKVAELAAVFQAHGITVKPYWSILGQLDFPTEGTTDFTSNSEQKAAFISKRLPDAIVVADDSGLVIPSLPDHFGVTTMRELKQHAITDAEMNDYILGLIAQHPKAKRNGELTTTLTAILPDGQMKISHGITKFVIPQQPVGTYSVGFDQIMWLPEVGMTLAQLPFQARLPFLPREQAVTELMKVLER